MRRRAPTGVATAVAALLVVSSAAAQFPLIFTTAWMSGPNGDRSSPRARIGDTVNVASRLESLNKDQARLRDNLKIIPMNSEPYKKFLEKFVTQEMQIENLQQRVSELQASQEKQTKEYEEYVTTLNAR